MGNAESGGCGGAAGAGSGDEEDVEAESPAFAGGGGSGGGGGGGSPACGAAAAGTATGAGARGAGGTAVPSSGLPSPEALMEQVKLREAAGRAGEAAVAVSESALARNESALVRWLEERLGRGEEAVSLEQFCELLESRDAPREECEEVGVILMKLLHSRNT